MDLDVLERSPAGILVPIKGHDARVGADYRHKAFVPAPLPEIPDLSAHTWSVVTDAALALGRLDQAGRQIPQPELIRRPSIRREAQSTSALEGTHAAFADLLESEVAPDEIPTPQVLEVRNYVRAAEHAFDWIVDRPITLGLIEDLQGILVLGTPAGLHTDAGKLRDRQVLIGPDNCSVEDARYVPPPPGPLLREGMDHWLRWVNDDSSLAPVVRAALAHYQFEAVHPFSDGNGRIGRLLIVVQLMQYGILREPLLIVSPWFEAKRREYQDQLLRVSETGEFDPWVAFFATGLRDQAISTAARVEQLLDYQQRTRQMLHENRIGGIAMRIAEDLIGNPIITIPWVEKTYEVSYQGAKKAIDRLMSAGVIRELDNRKYRRAFVSLEVLGLVEG